jgi:DNA-binding beta-propeller fold protein YncE
MNMRHLTLVAAGLVFVAGVVERVSLTGVAAQTKPQDLPVYEVDKDWPKLPPQYRLGTVPSFAVDSKDNVYFLTRPALVPPEDRYRAAPPVLVFDNAGNFLKAWGGAGAGYEWPEREHGIYIDPKGMVWITGSNCAAGGRPGTKSLSDDQILKFTPEGKFLLQIGHSSRSKGNADTENVSRAADLVVYPKTNELFVADGYGNHRVVVFDADSGKFKRMWGAFGKTPVDADDCTADKPAASKRAAFPPGPDSQNFSTVHSIRVSHDGTVYVADRENLRVQVFTAEGKFLTSLSKSDTPFARSLEFSVDPEQKFLFVGNEPDIVIVDRRSLQIVGSIAPPDVLRSHELSIDSKSNLYIAGTLSGYQRLAFKGMSHAASSK